MPRKTRGKSKVDALFRGLHSKKPINRAKALDALKIMIRKGNKQVLSNARKGLYSSNEVTRLFSASLLRKLKDKQSLQRFLELTKDSVPNIRSNAVLAIGHFGEVELIRPLIERLGDKDRGVRGCAWNAIEMLIGVNSTRAEEILIMHGLRSRDPLITETIEKILEEIMGKKYE